MQRIAVHQFGEFLHWTQLIRMNSGRVQRLKECITIRGLIGLRQSFARGFFFEKTLLVRRQNQR